MTIRVILGIFIVQRVVMCKRFMFLKQAMEAIMNLAWNVRSVLPAAGKTAVEVDERCDGERYG